MSVRNANCAEPDQTSRSAASDLGLRYLPMSPLWDAGLIWFKDVMQRLMIYDNYNVWKKILTFHPQGIPEQKPKV